MKHLKVALCLMALLLAFPCFAQDQKEAKRGDKVKVNAKELAEIKRQIRLMRAEMADLEEKIEAITGQHDNVYKTEQSSDDGKDSGSCQN